MLFVKFLLSGIILFLLIYAYSVVQLKKQNNELSSITDAKTADKIDKISFFEKFKRKKAPKLEPKVIEDSSVSVGGVTAKVSSPVKQVVAPIAEKVSNHIDQVAPQLTEDATKLSKLQKVKVAKGKENSTTDKKRDPSQLKETIDKQ